MNKRWCFITMDVQSDCLIVKASRKMIKAIPIGVSEADDERGKFNQEKESVRTHNAAYMNATKELYSGCIQLCLFLFITTERDTDLANRGKVQSLPS